MSDAKIDKAVNAIDNLIETPCDLDLCRSLHHRKQDQHDSWDIESCPVVRRVREAWKTIKKALEEL